jgi:hypothetical protein
MNLELSIEAVFNKVLLEFSECMQRIAREFCSGKLVTSDIDFESEWLAPSPWGLTLK